MTAREEILARVRASLDDVRRGMAPPLASVVEAERGELPRAYRRAGESPPSGAELLELFAERIEDYRATVLRASETELAGVVAGRLAGAGAVVAPADLPDTWLAGLGAGVVRRDDPPLSVPELDAADAVVTGCAVGIAETGTVVLDGGPGQGRRALSLVADHHVLVVRAEQVVRGVPEAVAALDPRRPQTWVSGPSATSDIELSRVEGVHGPRRLDVILVS